jgi:CheY-like chemotaxis protein/HPt (histidine-containing phosphotransfer) domain-containing protein
MAAEPAAASLVHVDLDGTRLLIVEPERSNHRVLQAYATAWGMRPACVENAADAITAIQDAARSGEPFDVALIDFDLPDRSGADLARQIRSTPALRGTRLIILAGTGEEHARARAAGAQESVTKPIRRSRLLEAITTVMRPAAMARHALVETQPQPAPAQEPSKARILVAEDQPINQLVIQRLLAHRGYNAECVGDGREVLARLEVEEYDLIFMDCQMPGLDGYETTREIRRRETEAGKHIPVVALTGHALEGDRQQCIAAGMDDYLAKPLRQEQLYEVLERWLPAEPEAREPVLDGSRIAELRGSFTREEMAGLLERFCANMPEVLDQLEHAVARADAAAIKSGAHRILGTASAVGARSMAALAAKLEQDARAYLDYETHTGGTDRLDATDPTIVSELRARWALTAEAIQREIGKLAQPVHAGVA